MDPKDMLPKSELDRQGQQLLAEITTALEKANAASLRELDARVQARIEGHGADVAKLSAEVKDLRGDYEKRFLALADQYAREPLHGGHQGLFATREQARLFGLVVLAANAKDPLASRAQAELQKAGINPGTGSGGGYLAPDLLLPGLIRNVEEAGVFERNCPALNVPVRSGAMTTRTGGLTVYYPDLEAATTASAPTFGRKQFACKRWSALALVERFMLSESLVVALGEYVALEIAYALARAEDTNWFIGTGTSTYAGHTGLFKLASGVKTVTGDSGDDTFAEVIAKSTYYLAKCAAQLPDWAHAAGPTWYMHSAIFFQYLGVRDSQGMPITNLFYEGGSIRKALMGYPVEWVQVAPSSTAVSTAFVLLAALRAACRVLRVAGEIEIRTSEHYKFAEGQIAYLGDICQDMIVVDGDAICQLITAGS